MAINGYSIFDSDLHVIEPADLWQRYIDPKYRDRALVGRPDEPFSTGNLFPFEGVPFSPTDEGTFSDMAAGHCLEQAHLRGRFEQYCEFERRGWGPDTQLEAMDAEGIDKAVLFPTRGLSANGREYDDDGLAAAISRAYNDWMADFCAADPERLLGAAMIHPQNVPGAVEEVRRAKRDLGFPGIYLRPNPVRERNWHDPAYDPLWAACEEDGLLVGFHEGFPCRLPHAVAERFSDGIADWWLTDHVTRHPIEMMYTAVCLINGGVLERFPGLRGRPAGGELQLGALLVVAHGRALRDPRVRSQGQATGAPQHLFHAPVLRLDRGGRGDRLPGVGSHRENVVFSTDFPHSDSAYPNALKAFLELPTSDENKRRILWDNCQRMYGFN